MGITTKQLEQLRQRLGSGKHRASAADAPDDAMPAADGFAGGVLLGIDPSLRGTGYGVIDTSAREPRAVEFGVIHCPPAWSRTRCLAEIARTFGSLLDRHAPAACCVEGLFYAQNPQTALIMGEARGAALAVVAERGVPVFEIAPRRAKLAIAGYGAAQKTAVAKMVQRLLGLDAPPQADAADALALALAFAQTRRGFGTGAPKRV
jgi:crossover junction endodeoxyribonuclease RuvC